MNGAGVWGAEPSRGISDEDFGANLQCTFTHALQHESLFLIDSRTLRCLPL